MAFAHVGPSIRQVALSCADPSSWACIRCTAHAILNEGTTDFELDWFLQWQPILCPHRPWQCAVLTWRRMQGQPPHRVAHFMLRVLQAKQQQQQQSPALDPESFAAQCKYATNLENLEGHFAGVFPNLRPLPSTLRRVTGLLGKQDSAADMQALLLLLCPCIMSLVCQYAARDATAPTTAAGPTADRGHSSRVPLLQRLVQHARPASIESTRIFTFLYTQHFLQSSITRLVVTHRLGCMAALAAGRAPQLLWNLHRQFTAPRGRNYDKPVLLALLLPYAVRYSTAECVQAVLMQFVAYCRVQMLAPQHLTLAAQRRDPWAAGVVQLLLEFLSPQQLKPSHMRAAYRAASGTGYLPVLQLLLAHAAATAPQQHLLVLFPAVADSGTQLAAELLLGDMQAALQQQGRQQAHAVQAQEQEVLQQQQQLVQDSVQLLRAAAARLDLKACIQLLAGLLPWCELHDSLAVEAYCPELDAVRVLMAERLWLLLPAGTQAGLQQVCSDAAWTHTVRNPRTPEERSNFSVRLLKLTAPAPPRLVTDVEAACRHALCTGVGTHAALQLRTALLRHSNGSAGGDAAAGSASSACCISMAVMQGRLAAACAACDAPAVEQLQRVYMLGMLLLSPPNRVLLAAQFPWAAAASATTISSIVPTLPVSLAAGKVVTVAHLSAALGLPWQLLASLLQAAGYGQAAASASAADSGASSSCSVQQEVSDAMLAVGDPAATGDARRLPNLSRFALELAAGMPEPYLQAMGLQLLLPRQGDALLYGQQQPEPPPDLASPQLAARLAVAYEHDLKQLLVSRCQQGQQGVLPLWQQCVLQVLAQGAPRVVRRDSPVQFSASPSYRGVYQVHSNPCVLLRGLQQGRSEQEVQDFISTVLLQDAPPDRGPGLPGYAPLGPLILHKALLHRAPRLLAWSLQERQQQVLWGRRPDAVSHAVMQLLEWEGCSPINCCCLGQRQERGGSLSSTHHHQLRLQQRDLAELQQQREQLLGPGGAAGSSCQGPMVCAAGPLPGFAAAAVQLALPLLQHPGAAEGLLDNWLRCTLGIRSSLADLVRARAIVAAVAACAVLPPGARVIRREALRQVLAVGEADLWSVVLLWCHRLRMQPEDEEEEPGVPVDGDNDDDPLGALLPVGVGGADAAAGVQQLAAGLDAVNI